MTTSVANLGSSTHHVVQDLLPWHVMGTLDAEDRPLVDEHLRTCLICQRDIQWHEQMRAAHEEPIPALDAERAFASLRMRLGNSSPVPAPRTPARMRGWDWPWMKWAMAAQFALIVGLGITLALDRSESAAYHVLGSPGAAQAGARLVVVFAPQVSEEEMRRILRQSSTRIVDGPTTTDAYILAVAPEHAQLALQALRAERSVHLVQALDAGDAN
ncbi:MAG: zf-HC2 domain-containing protein [Rudaea sp.]|nr:zf-HC2 domain-containing protein [Rudaea sp.]